MVVSTLYLTRSLFEHVKKKRQANNQAAPIPKLIGKFWDDNAVNALFQQAPTGFNDFVQAFRLLNPVYGCTRADLFRYLVMYLEGGLYFDCKSGCDNTKKFAAHAPLAPLVLTHWGTRYSS